MLCLAIPLKIIKINGKEAIGELNGIERTIRIDMIGKVELGDYVIVHAGFALNKLETNDAKELLGYLSEMM